VPKWLRSRFSATALLALLTLHSSLLAVGVWRGVYHDGPVALSIKPNQRAYTVGDNFRLSLTAINTSDRVVLIKRDWGEQLVFYHLHPTTGEQVEWPGRLLIATWLDSSDVVRLRPGESYKVERRVRVWTADDVATFQFRAKLGGVKDYGRRFDTWQGVAWSNPITLTVRPRQRRN